MIYQWKDGSRYHGDAQKAGEFLEKVASRNHGVLTAVAVVDAARSVRSPIHNDFEWDNEVAAEEYRKVQARSIIRSIVTVQPAESAGDDDLIIRAYFVVHDGDEKAYVPTARILSDEEMRAELLEQAMGELTAVKRKYETLSELEPVWFALAEVEA